MPTELEPRLQTRYEHLVLGHVQPLHEVAAGVRTLPRLNDTFAATQAAWRFWANPRTTLTQLAQPLLEAAACGIRQDCLDYALVVHDWSQLHYHAHTAKRDRVPLANSQDLGYELQTALALSDRDGSPIAPLFQSLRAAAGVFSSRTNQVRQAPTKLDRLAPVMRLVKDLKLARPAVHIIDREADSVGHYRTWARQGRLFLVRADDNRKIFHQGQECLLPDVVTQLRQRGTFQNTREVLYHGRKAQQWVAETQVTLHRPAKHNHGRELQAGKALPLRLVVSEVRDAGGAVLAVWLLLSNVPAAVSAGTLALWYYWRWQIESYFKLLKSAGLHLEHWQQESGLATAKRLLVAAMACVLVWRVGRSAQPAAVRLRDVLVRLSGRQMKYGVAATDPALLAGLWTLLSALELVESHDLQELRELLMETLGQPDSPKSPPNAV